MQLATKLRKHASSFASNQSGNIFMITALTIFAVMGAAGVAVDYSRVSNAKFQMEQSLDAALLATGVEVINGENDPNKLRAYFDKFFMANLEGQSGFGEEFRVTAFSFDPDTGEVSAETEVYIEATLMRAFGHDDLEIRSNGSAIFDRTDVEVAMMLDVTGSMRGQKLRDLKAAAQDAIDILMPNNSSSGTRISLVPYAGSVNVKGYKEKVVSGGTQVADAGEVLASGDTHGTDGNCVTERGGFYAATDESYKQARIGDDVRTDRSAFKCPRDKSSIEPLTDRKSKLKSKIRGFSATGVTAGHLGIAWSYYTLSEKWRDLWKNGSKPAAYSAGTQKIAILMTDGEFNTYYYGTTEPGNPDSAYGGENIDNSNTLAMNLCEDMKADKNGAPGITIYSIAFQAPASAEATLRACANDDTETDVYYFSADNGQELRDAFRSIAASIQRLRISS